MHRTLRLLHSLVSAGLLGLAAADARAQAGPEGPPEPAAPAALVFHSDTITVLRATVAGVLPGRRVELARSRLEALRMPGLRDPIRVEAFGGGHAVLIGDAFTFMVAPGDLQHGARRTTLEEAETAAGKLGKALAERARMMTPGARLRATLKGLGATLALLTVLWLLRWMRRVASGWLESRSKTGRGRLGEMDLLPQIAAAATLLARIVAQLAGLVLIGLWLVFLLNLFPETEQWGSSSVSFLLGLLGAFQAAVLRALPGIFAIVLIVIVVRFATQLSDRFFAAVERGTLRVPGVHPETAGATRRLVNAILWLFAVVVAYPLLPGSDSIAFKGVSVFLGILVTLGSTGVVGHMMSGLVLVYSRAMKPGDWVRIGEIEGFVAEVGALSVKIANLKDEEFTIPNAVMVGTTVKNYSRLGHERGSPLTTMVTIGYDAPWRVVYEMLLGAAEKTPGIRKQPAPSVLQSSLSDFFVEYTLIVRLEDERRRPSVLSTLHQNIQDAFNERGVQIMSPHFETQPDRPVVVAKSKWNVAPGDRKGSGES